MNKAVNYLIISKDLAGNIVEEFEVYNSAELAIISLMTALEKAEPGYSITMKANVKELVPASEFLVSRDYPSFSKPKKSKPVLKVVK